MKASAALCALLLPCLVAAAPAPSPLPTANPSAPCGYVEFVPAGPPRWSGGTSYERIKATVTFADGHRESAVFPYVWVYPNGEQTDPWSYTNLKRPEFTVTLQRPPAGADVSTYSPLITYVLDHSTADGHTTLPSCPRSKGESSPVADPLQRAPVISSEAPVARPVWLALADRTPHDAPVTIVDAFLFHPAYGGEYRANVVHECVTFWNRSPQVVAAIRFTFTYDDDAGQLESVQTLDRFGTFGPGAVVEGVRRGIDPGRASADARKNCRPFVWSGKVGPSRVAVSRVVFADDSVWSPR
jgi:hypothetical protein